VILRAARGKAGRQLATGSSRSATGADRQAGVRRRLAAGVSAAILIVVCAVAVVGFQVSRPRTASSSPTTFVPSPKFFNDVSPGFRTFVSDLYWLATVQYYGEHVNGDGRLDSLPEMLDLVTDLSPHFSKAYLFGAFGLLDAGKAQQAYQLLVRGAKENPDDWKLASTVGIFIYSFAKNKDKAALAAKWYEKAAQIPGHPAYVDRLAAELTQKGGEAEKAATMWAQVYADGDKYSKGKAVDALRQILASPTLKLTTREKQLEFLWRFQTMMTPVDYQQLVLDVVG
jgi:tetratricopeptide (TPR) repeat protein